MEHGWKQRGSRKRDISGRNVNYIRELFFLFLPLRNGNTELELLRIIIAKLKTAVVLLILVCPRTTLEDVHFTTLDDCISCEDDEYRDYV